MDFRFWQIALLGLTLPLGGCFLFGGDETPSGTPDGGIGTTCESTAQCSGDLVCASGNCQEPGSAGLSGPCWANRDCQEGLYCSPAGVCGPAGSGAVGDECLTGGECADDLVCELVGFSGTCQMAGSGDVGETCEVRSDCLAGLVCAPDGTCQHSSVAFPPFTGIECAPDDDAAPFRAFFEVPRAAQVSPEFFRLPFPNDARVSAAGELDMTGFPRPGPNVLGVDLVSLYVDAWVSDFEGFGATVPVQFRFSKQIDFDSAVPEIVDITAGTPEYGQTRGRSWLYRGAEKFRCQNNFAVTPSVIRPLLPGHTYAVYFNDGVRSAEGETPQRDADFAAMVGATRPTDAELGAAWDQYQPLRDYLADTTQGIDPDGVIVATVFTVADSVGRGKALADAALATAAPALSDVTLCDGVATSPCEDADGRGACGPVDPDFFEIHGRFAVPFYQAGTPPFEQPSDGGNINFTGGVPQQVGTQDVCFALTIPRGGVMPANGWPLIVGSHGTGGSFTGVVANGIAKAAAIAPNPVAVLAYDGVAHGSRRAGSTQSPDNLVFNVLNPHAARDNHAQGLVDIIYAMRLPELGDVALPGPGTVNFDSANVYFLGHSQGANVGIPAVAVSDQARGAVFSGAGSHLSRGMLTKTSPVDSKAGLELLIGDALSLDHPVVGIIQNFFTTVETVNYAPVITQRPASIGLAPKDVWMSYGLGDTFSPPETLAITARGMFLETVNPVLEDIGGNTVDRPVSGNGPLGTFAAVFQLAPSGYDGHFVALRDPGLIAEWTAFLQSLIATGTATVP